MNEAISTSLLKVGAIPVKPESAAAAVEPEGDAALRARMAAAVRAVCPLWMSSYQEDIVQTAMMALIRQRSKGEGDRRFSSSYLKKAAYTALIDAVRWVRSRGEVSLEAPEGEMMLIESSANPEKRSIASEIAAGVRGCLTRLAPTRQMAVTLHLLGHNVPRIADKMGWTRKQAENLVYRGMSDLRDCLRARGLEP